MDQDLYFEFEISTEFNGFYLLLGVYDSSFDKTDRKISAHATLQTPPTRTAFPGDDNNKNFIPPKGTYFLKNIAKNANSLLYDFLL